MASCKGGTDGAEHFRMLLLGKTGSGKSSTGNTILGIMKFPSSCHFSSVTSDCKLEEGKVSGILVEILDCPGLCDTRLSDVETGIVISKAVMGLHPGPHVLLYVISTDRFTEEDYQVFKKLECIFDERMYDYVIVVITGGDNFEADGISPEDAIKKAPPALTDVLKICHNRYIIFNNRALNKQPQVDKLLGMVRKMVKMNSSNPHYRCARYDFLSENLEKEVRDRIAKMEEGMLQKQNKLEDRLKYVEDENEMLRKRLLIEKETRKDAVEGGILARAKNGIKSFGGAAFDLALWPVEALFGYHS